MTLTCRETVARLWAFHDDALPADQQSAVAGHLGGCAECRSHFDHAAEFLSVLRGAEAPTGSLTTLEERVALSLAMVSAGE